MTFEEFFKKKRIDVKALQAAEPALSLEFKIHFEQMGEKSFDHTKKYWFNKLRLLYHLPPEQKPEKLHIENPLAEQTIVESLTELVAPPKIGFKPKFKAAVANPTEQAELEKPQQLELHPAVEKDNSSEVVELPAEPKPAFKPRFNMKVAAPKTETADTPTEEAGPEITNLSVPIELPETKAAYKPKFNMKNIKPKPPQE